MRKNILALSIAAMVGGLSGVANAAVITTGTADALQINPQGIGHILLVPYFSTQENNKTLLSLTNTDLTNGKAVKLRFRGASNSDDIFDITVYLSPGDVWTADVAKDAAGFSRLVTTDNSCTLPSIQEIKDADNGRFKTNRVQGADAKQTREGYVEILNTANIAPGSALYTAIKHVNNKAPCTTAVMDAQVNDLAADGSDAAARGYSNPTGGLMANWILVNLDTMASHSGEAVAVQAELAGESAAGNIVWFPQTSDVAVGNVADFTADPLLNSAGFTGTANYDFPDLSTPYLTGGVTPSAQAAALSNSLAVTSVANEFVTSNGFSTDWVFSMPTRRYAVALDYAAAAAGRILFNAANNAHFSAKNTTLNADGSLACVKPGIPRSFNREEDTQQAGFVISPGSATVVTYCGETSVLAFNSAGLPSVLGSLLARNDIKTRASEGWLTIPTPGATAAAGLPIVGFAATKVSGANLGGTWKHRGIKAVAP